MIAQNTAELDDLFVSDINELERLGRADPRSRYQHLQMSGILRRLVLDKHSLVHHATRRCKTRLLILVPEPISGNPKYSPRFQIPDAIRKYAPNISSINLGFNGDAYFLCPYNIDEYLGHTHMVLPVFNDTGSLKGRPITPKEMILLLANKLGGVHVEKELRDISNGGESVDAETLMCINKNVSIFDGESIFHQFGVVAERIWRACAPLRDEIIVNQSLS